MPRKGLAGCSRALGARYWHRASAQETHDQLFNRLPASSETERGASSPERRGAEASPLRSGHRGRALWTCSDATAVPASSGQKAGRHRCRAAQSPFGSAGPPAALPIPRQRHRVSSRLCPRLPGSSRRQQHLPPSLTPLHLLIRCLQDFYLPWATPRRVYLRNTKTKRSSSRVGPAVGGSNLTFPRVFRQIRLATPPTDAHCAGAPAQPQPYSERIALAVGFQTASSNSSAWWSGRGCKSARLQQRCDMVD